MVVVGDHHWQLIQLYLTLSYLFCFIPVSRKWLKLMEITWGWSRSSTEKSPSLIEVLFSYCCHKLWFIHPGFLTRNLDRNGFAWSYNWEEERLKIAQKQSSLRRWMVWREPCHLLPSCSASQRRIHWSWNIQKTRPPSIKNWKYNNKGCIGDAKMPICRYIKEKFK